jgi:hypothetical protein
VLAARPEEVTTLTLAEITEVVGRLHIATAAISAKVDAGQDLTEAEREQWYAYGWLIAEKWRLEDEQPPRRHE